ncbi:MAG: ATP-binding protein, partial [Clostridium sp.]
MRKKLFVFFMIIIILTVGATGLVSYRFTKNIILETNKESLKAQVDITSEYLEKSSFKDINNISQKIKDKVNRRITIITIDGTVVGESNTETSKLDNHKNRKEVKEAFEKGVGDSIRYSNTEKANVYYYAQKIKIEGKDYVLRFSVKLDTIKQIQNKYNIIILLTIILGIIISSILTYVYLRLKTKPIINLTKIATTISSGDYDRRITVDSNDEIGQIAGAFNLMSQSLQDTIASLGDKNNKLMSILANSEDGVIIVDDNNKILMLNPAAQILFDLDDNTIGKHLIEVIRNYDLQNIIRDVPEKEAEAVITYPSERTLKIRVINAINYNEGKEVLGFLIIVQDITKVKKLEQMRSDFVTNVTHELKTPLTSIKGFAETLKYVEDKQTHDKFLDIINIEAERLSRLINDILILSEIENNGTTVCNEKVNVLEAVNEVCHITKPISDMKKIYIEVEASFDNYLVLGNKDKFKQMLINLVENAIKYTNEGGEVHIYITESGNNIIIQVRDNGIGITSEHIGRLFERFYRVDKGRSRDSGGTGLGLAIVKHIVILLNGD